MISSWTFELASVSFFCSRCPAMRWPDVAWKNNHWSILRVQNNRPKIPRGTENSVIIRICASDFEESLQSFQERRRILSLFIWQYVGHVHEGWWSMINSNDSCPHDWLSRRMTHASFIDKDILDCSAAAITGQKIDHRSCENRKSFELFKAEETIISTLNQPRQDEISPFLLQDPTI